MGPFIAYKRPGADLSAGCSKSAKFPIPHRGFFFRVGRDAKFSELKTSVYDLRLVDLTAVNRTVMGLLYFMFSLRLFALFPITFSVFLLSLLYGIIIFIIPWLARCFFRALVHAFVLVILGAAFIFISIFS